MYMYYNPLSLSLSLSLSYCGEIQMHGSSSYLNIARGLHLVNIVSIFS